jgi:hypothetical protein
LHKGHERVRGAQVDADDAIGSHRILVCQLRAISIQHLAFSQAESAQLKKGRAEC